MAKKIVIASGKGGVGKTSVAIGLSKALAARGRKVILIDCDILRSVDLIIGAGETMLYDWGDVLLERCEADDAIYRVSDIYTMTCPKSYRDISLRKMKQLLALLDKKFDYILLDSPAGVEVGFVFSCIGADSGIIVSTPDLVCVRSACFTGDEMEKYGVRNIRLIINRAVVKDIKKSRLLNFDSVIDETEIQLLGVVPEDDNIRYSAMGGRIYSKKFPSYHAFSNIAARIEGENRPLSF